MGPDYGGQLVVSRLHLLDVSDDGVLRVESVQRKFQRRIRTLGHRYRESSVVDQHFRVDAGFRQVDFVVIDESAHIYRAGQERGVGNESLHDLVDPQLLFNSHIFCF